MAKKVIVGGRIESKEVGGIVTGAAEILDDTKGKKQSVINQETDAEMERLDGAKQDVLTFDNTPTEGSNNPVTSGGLYLAQLAIIQAIAAINELIPSAASALNKLADTAFVNSSISTNTATFRGTSASGLTEQQFLAWANGLTHDLNDYVFWQTVDAAGNTLFKRYKWNGTEWAYEYTLNNSTFTAEQWEAIQSGITALLVTKLRALPTAQELIQSFDGKQDVLTFDNVPTLGSNNPVKSSGIYNVIKAITDLIPAEATAQNQLADKADVAAKIVAAIPSWKGQYDALTDLQAVTGAKAGDMGCVKTTDSDGHAVLTFYQYSAQGAWVVYYVLRHYAQNKPATTGTTGDYPYNGMGRIELQKNIVNGVNTLTQAMLTQQNTIYVIQYDFTLGENITVPENCVLEFDGGSIVNTSGNTYTIDFNNCVIKAEHKIFDSVLPLQDSEFWQEINPRWFGVVDDGVTDNVIPLNNMLTFASRLKKYGISFRMLGKTVPTIKFDMTGPIKITSPIEITIACNILGFPTFYYTGQHISGSGAIIINNGEVGGKYEFNVTSFLTGTVDLSDGVLFAGVHLKYHMYGDIEIKEINGFNTGILLCGISSESDLTAACFRLNPRRISCCLNAIYAQIYNGTWPNEIELYGCMFGGMGSSSISAYPSSFSRGAFIKFIGDGSGRPNSWHIHDNALESKLGTHPIDFIYSDIPYNDDVYELSGFALDNNRVEDVGGYLANLRKDSKIYIDEHQYFETNTIRFRDYGVEISYSLAFAFGITPDNFPAANEFTFETQGILRESIIFQLGLFFTPFVAVVVNGAQLSASVVLKLKPKEKIWCKRRLGTNGFQPWMALDSSLNPIAIPDTLICREAGKEREGTVDYFMLYNQKTITSFTMFNNSDSDIYVALGAKTIPDLRGTIIKSTQKIDIIDNDVLTKGTTAQRTAMPALSSYGSYPDAETYKGFEFFDTTLGKPVYWNGSAWVDATGTPV